MQDFSVSDANIPDLLAVVANGESVRLLEEGRTVAVVNPPPAEELPAGVVSPPEESSGSEEHSLEERPPFVSWVAELREKYDWDQHGFTKEEVDSWRDKSPGREPPF